jgi:hypothetical protein
MQFFEAATARQDAASYSVVLVLTHPSAAPVCQADNSSLTCPLKTHGRWCQPWLPWPCAAQGGWAHISPLSLSGSAAGGVLQGRHTAIVSVVDQHVINAMPTVIGRDVFKRLNANHGDVAVKQRQ